jgi:hypothetical protein
MRNTSILLGLASTIVALIVPDGAASAFGESSSDGGGRRALGEIVLAEASGARRLLNEAVPDWGLVMYVVSIVLPAILLIVDQVEAYLGTHAAADAVERASGLVDSHSYRYKTQSGNYADSDLHDLGAEDLATARQLLLAKRLDSIQQDVAKSGASVPLDPSGKMLSGGDMLGPAVGAKGSAEADRLEGDEYLKIRVEPQIGVSSREAQKYLLYSLVSRVALFVASAVGTTIATLGFSRYVAVTVSFSTSVSRWLGSTRVEEQRKAHMKAASELNGAKLRWEALPREKRAQQMYIDQLVLGCEDILEATLPPAREDAAGDKHAKEGPPKTDPRRAAPIEERLVATDAVTSF